MSEHRITYVTAPSEVAEQIATTLVEDGLVVCVNIVEQVRTIYKWEGSVEKSYEALMIIKTAADKTDELIEKVREIHPYEVPEVISFDITAGNQDYLDWLSGKEIVVEEALLDDDEDEEEGEEEEKAEAAD
ncbi:MAG: divalent-cation tolerance protein CutA [FCB group bacterium]|nr:divalent-cation tolerance protein CutA [FCB group bacterium]